MSGTVAEDPTLRVEGVADSSGSGRPEMASIDKRPNGKWRARWREYPGGPQRARHFVRKIDADGQSK